MQVKKLEETLQRTLFVREARRVRMTREGEALLSYAQRLIALNEEAVASFLSPDVEGSLAFGVTDDLGTRVLPDLLARFARTHPAVLVDVVTGRTADMRTRVEEGSLDLALVTGGSNIRRASGDQTIHTEELVWAGLEDGTAAQRSPLPLALAAEGCIWRAMSLKALDRAGIDYRIAYTSEHTAGQQAAMMADLAVAPFPRGLVHPPLKRLAPETGLPDIGRYHVVMVRSRRPSEAAEALAAHVTEQFESMS